MELQLILVRKLGSKVGLNRVRHGAFTLVELLVVIAVIGILMMFVLPASSGVLSGISLTQSGQTLMDKAALCRQLAMTHNRDMELRIVTIPGTNSLAPAYAHQIWRYDEYGANPVPYDRVHRIPDTIRIDADLSPIMPLLTSGTANFNTLGGNRSYRAMRYRANGRLHESLGVSNYLTLTYYRDTESPPANFYTIQINPVSGLISGYRP